MDFCSECGSMILNGSKCPMCGCIKTAETKEVKKTPRPEKKKTNKKPVIETFTKDIKTEPEKIASKNGKYLKKDYKSIDDLDDKTRQELLANDKFFKTVNSKPLDTQQKIACVLDSKNVQIIAGAGTGKTFTLIAKIKYLIAKKHVRPEDILCLSFSNTSVRDLKGKLPENVEVRTFHSLGRSVIKQHHKVSVIENNEILAIINDYLANANTDTLKDILEFCDSYFLNIESYIIRRNDRKELLNELKEAFTKVAFKPLLADFINLFKGNNFTKDYFSYFRSSNDDKDHDIFLKIAEDFYSYYQEYLDMHQQIDFNDMINESSKLIKKYGLKKHYRYILVDEYQDTTYTNYNLIKSLQDKTDAHLTVVGDDWQSIYGFRGTNIEFFSHFEEYFENPQRIFIEKTYRNPQELIDIAGSFIMKNPKQIRKSLKSPKNLKKPVKIIYPQKNPIEKREMIYNLIKDLSEKSDDVLILGRTNNNINQFIKHRNLVKKGNLKKDKFLRILDKTDKSMNNVYYRTLHSSKGLEADNVIIINMVDDYLGFPSKLKTHSVLNYVNTRNYDYKYSKGLEADNVIIINMVDDYLGFPSKLKTHSVLNYVNTRNYDYKYSEERRLFYVGLTRSKNNVYLISDKNNPSEFIEELMDDSLENLEIIEYN